MDYKILYVKIQYNYLCKDDASALQGEVIAMDRIGNKVEKIKQNASVLKLHSIQAYSYNSTKAVTHDASDNSQGKMDYFLLS